MAKHYNTQNDSASFSARELRIDFTEHELHE